METVEIVIVGAGPAGLSAALYAARFCRSTLVVHDGKTRAARIPVTQNVPGFDAGVAGPDLLDRMRRHAEKFGARFVETHIESVARTPHGFRLLGVGHRAWEARALILATGVELNQIPLDDKTHEAAIAAGVLRYCPVCDGYEHRSERVGVVGCDASGAAEALFMKQFSQDVTLLPRQDVELTAAERRDLEEAGVRTVTQAVARFVPREDTIDVCFEDSGEKMTFDVLYPALGSRPRNRLAKALGLTINEAGNVDAHAPLDSGVPGLFAAGDLVDGLDQISVAMGQGAVAATKAHNWLRARDGKTVERVIEGGTPA